MKQRQLVGFLTPFLLSGLVACGADRPVKQAPEVAKSSNALDLVTYTESYLEVDEIAGGPGDANLFMESPLYKYPVPDENNPPPDAAWVDWESLEPVTHRLQDLNNDKDVDTSSFPRSNECVGESKVLSKMDLTYVGVANNQDYAYFTVQRSNNNGDAGYYWLMTKLEPTMELGAGPCRPEERQLVFDIRKGDVLLAGHFQPSNTPLLEAYRALNDVDDLTAVQAIDFTSGLWEKDAGAVEAAAVNESNIPAGRWGKEGVQKQALTSSGELQQWIFAEAAVQTSLFTNGPVCDATFFGTVITRSSGSGGVTPDLKDLAGPQKFAFGTISAETTITPSCEEMFTYGAKLKGLDDEYVENASCSWEVKNANGDVVATSIECSGDFSLPEGTYTAQVTLSDPLTSCSTVVPDLNVEIFTKLKATASLTPTCLSKFGYAGSGQDGKPPYTYAWTFWGGGSVDPEASSLIAGDVAVGEGNKDYYGKLKVTDARGCAEEVTTDPVRPFDPMEVTLGFRAFAEVCSSNNDEVTFVATATGGNGDYSFGWTSIGSPGCVPGPDGTCVVNPSDSDFCVDTAVSVEVSDSSGLCDKVAPPAQGVYSKQTTLTAEIQPKTP